ncbi:efflux RND transporter periplasmic adaptor subunit [Vibrio amylolyticus]|uniref:efflux RND transporter periplasmic adaptor subunit n=1 Tax=Vibrio amylolyticus TaxID=2847292 RepID=UPI00354C16C8
MRYQKLSSLSLTVSAMLLLSACSEVQTAEAPSRTLLTVESQPVIEQQSYSVGREYVGVINSAQRANLGFELSGKVSDIYVDVGQTVTKGQKLVTLDTQLLGSELKELQAQLDEVKAQQKLTETNLNRQHALKKKGYSSDSEIDALVSQKDALAANLLRIQSAVEANRLKLKKSTIRAPYDGIVSKRFVSLGDVVGVGTSTFSLLSTSGKEAVIGVNSRDLKDIQAQDEFVIRVRNQEYSARLISKASNIDANSRSISLRFLLDETNSVLDGELAYLTFDKHYPEQGFWLPTTALIDGIRGTWNIYALNSTDGENQVERRVVNVLFANNESVYVKGALNNGDQVITSGLHKVVPGQSVSVAK